MGESGQKSSSAEMPDPGRAFPADLANLIEAYCNSEQYRLYSPRRIGAVPRVQLEQLLIQAFNASLGQEEGRPVRLSILFDPSQAPERVTLPFESAVPYTDRHLVRIAPAIGLDFHALLVTPTPDDPKLQIQGIWDPTMSPASPNYEHQLAEGHLICSFPTRA